MSETDNRRPSKSRQSAWAERLAGALARARVAPDMISFMGLAFAIVAAGAFGLSGLSFGPARSLLLVLAAITVQLRQLCNLLDGMVAIEHGRAGRRGVLWKEIPNRISDVAILAAAGYGAVHADRDIGPGLGWLCACLALMMAYVRELGRTLDCPADFSGPMAKPQRMGVLTLAALVSLTERFWPDPSAHGRTLLVALALIATLSVVTLIRRITRLSRILRERRRTLS